MLPNRVVGIQFLLKAKHLTRKSSLEISFSYLHC